MKHFNPISFMGLTITVISAYLPWVSFNIPTIGAYVFTVPDLVRLLGVSEQSSQAYSQLISLFGTSVLFAGLSIALLIMTALFGIIGIAKSQANVISSISAILSCVLWIAGINYLKSDIIKQTVFFGHLLNPIVEVGIGPWALAFAGFIFLVAFALKERLSF